MKRPPLGLMPQWCWKKLRVRQIELAIRRYKYHQKQIPDDWIVELSNHKFWLKHR